MHMGVCQSLVTPSPQGELMMSSQPYRRRAPTQGSKSEKSITPLFYPLGVAENVEATSQLSPDHRTEDIEAVLIFSRRGIGISQSGVIPPTHLINRSLILIGP